MVFETRTILRVVLVMGVLVALIALDFAITGGNVVAGQYGRHGSS